MSDTRDPAEGPVKDSASALIHVLAASLHGAWRMQSYAEDAARAGAESGERFRGIRGPGLPPGEPSGHVLRDRLGDESNAAA